MEFVRFKNNCERSVGDSSDGNVIEIMKITRGGTLSDKSYHHSLLFVMEGCASLNIESVGAREIRKGHFIYLQSGCLNLYATTNVVIIMVRTLTMTELCDSMKLGSFYSPSTEERAEPEDVNFSVATPSIWHYLKGLYLALDDGIANSGYFDIKVKELFLLMRTYYSSSELHRIFLPVLSSDLAFSDTVKTSWFKYKTIDDLAEAMNFAPSSFYRHFQKTFGCTAQQWITEQKKIRVYRELMDNNANFKELADKYWFSSVTSFYNWCIKTYGNTPGDMRKKLIS